MYEGNRRYYLVAMNVATSVVKRVNSTKMPCMWIIPTRNLHITQLYILTVDKKLWPNMHVIWNEKCQ